MQTGGDRPNCQRCIRLALVVALSIIHLLVLTAIYIIITNNTTRNPQRVVSEMWSQNKSSITNELHLRKEAARSEKESVTLNCRRQPRPLLISIWHGWSWVNTDNVTLDRRHCGAFCCFTKDPLEFNYSDAVVFEGDLMRRMDFPSSRPNIAQKWIYKTMETPLNTAMSAAKRIRIRQQRHLYNLTATFSSLSDVPTPYFSGKCSLSDDSGNSSMQDEELRRLTKRKSRPIAWFVTHCWTSSKRER